VEPRRYAAMNRSARGTALVAAVALLVPVQAAQGVLVVHVTDTANRPLLRVQLATKGSGGVGTPTDAAGRTRIVLAPETKPQTVLALTIVAPENLVFISPWDSQLRVPPFENESQNFASVVLARRGDRALLENPRVVNAAVAQVNLSTSTRERAQPPLRPADALAQTAASLGVQPSELEAAILGLSKRTSDPYDSGMAALYAGRLDEATALLADAAQNRAQRAVSGARDAADAAFFLAQALYRQGKYTESAGAYRQALGLRPGDPATTNNLGLTLLQAGDYAGAEPLLRLAIATIEAAKGKDDPDIVFSLNNLGTMLVTKGDVEGAEAAFRRGLEVRRTALGANNVRTANSMTNLASALLQRGSDAEADSLLMSALDIFDAAPPEPPTLVPGARPMSQMAITPGGVLSTPGRAAVRLNQAILARHRGRLAESKAIAQEVLRNETQRLNPTGQERASATIVLAQAELAAGEAAAAAAHFEGAIETLQTALGPRHPALADPLSGLGDAAARTPDPARAESAYRRAIAIRRSSFGTADPIAAEITKKLSALAR
jgi:tetratricopeptide (TPR) repeat protein